MAKKNATTQQKEAEENICQLCRGYGYYLDEEGYALRCNCNTIGSRAFATRLESSGIPSRFLTKDFTNFNAKGDRPRQQILQAANAYATGFSREEPQGLILRGKTGSGKTHIAIAILKEVMKRGFSGYYANFNDLLSRMRDTYTPGTTPMTEGLILGEVDKADMLVLDDLGAEALRDWMRDRLYLIINRRYEGGKATIITTNCNEAELEAHVGPRTFSRLCEMCDWNFPTFPNQDFRRANMF